jgi:Lrp/AsnC family transcriptional regulator, leucine-responsive regulatory protein
MIESNANAIDPIDRRILRILQRNGRIPNNELADAVNLSPSTCLRRVKRLEDDGVIDRYVAILRPEKIERGATFFIRIWLKAQNEETLQNFADDIATIPQILECYFMLGDCDALVRVVARDIQDYRRFQSEQLNKVRGIQNFKTDVPSQIIKPSSELPV